MVAIRIIVWTEHVDIYFWQCVQGKIDMNTADRETSAVHKIALSGGVSASRAHAVTLATARNSLSR